MLSFISVKRIARLASPFVAVAALALPAFAGGCSSDSASCPNNKTQTYTQTCDALTSAFAGKCAGMTIDCTKLVVKDCQTNAQAQICSSDVDAVVQKLNGAASCDDALKVTSSISCLVKN